MLMEELFIIVIFGRNWYVGWMRGAVSVMVKLGVLEVDSILISCVIWLGNVMVLCFFFFIYIVGLIIVFIL